MRAPKKSGQIRPTTEPETPSRHKDQPLAIFAGLVLSLLTRFVYYTSRKNFIAADRMQGLMCKSQPFIIASWHDRIMLSPFTYLHFCKKPHRLVPLASSSKDGAIAAWAMRGLGLHCARGSSSKGGSRALRGMLGLLKAGNDLAFTPDGPRGPRHKVQGGVILAAKLSGVPIIPVSFQAKRRKTLRSWDRMIVPAPFNHFTFVYGEPLFVPKDLSTDQMEAYCLKLERALLEIDQIAEDAYLKNDRGAGH